MKKVSRVRTYDLLSRWYSTLAETSEGPLRRQCLAQMQLVPGECILEVGSGPGTDLPAMAQAVGRQGRVWGLDLSWGMLTACRRCLPGAPVALVQGDALRLPFSAGSMDAVLFSFTLELLSDEDAILALDETTRVLKVGGRLGIVSLSGRHPQSLATRLYWMAHRAMPRIFDCRPIEARAMLESHGFTVDVHDEESLWGLRAAILVARRP